MEWLALTPTTVLVFVVVFVLLYFVTRRPTRLPPGPSALSLISSMFQGNQMEMFRKFRKQYGDIFCFYVLNKPLIVLNDYQVIKNAFVKNGDVFSDRPHSIMTDVITDGRGVVFNSGEPFRQQRRFCLNTLKEFGFGRTIMEDKIHEEIAPFLSAIEEERGQPFEMKRLTHNAISNIVCSIVFGKRFAYTDDQFVKLMKGFEENLEAVSFANVIEMFPFVRYLPGDMLFYHRTKRNVRILDEVFIRPSIKHHLDTYEEGNESDFIYAYIKEMKERKNGTDAESNHITLPQLEKTITDLFVAGTETTGTSIRWTLVYLLNYPEVQDKCFREIEEHVGLNRPPVMKDKSNLPYVEATITEAMRCGMTAPTSVPHTVPHDIEFQGYRFPKGVTIFANLESVLQDEKIWGDPHIFRPERFLDEQGNFQKKDEFIPFSIGRRYCLGESLAMMELFLFIVSMLQRFRFEPDGEKPSMEGVFAATHFPQSFKMKAVSRH